MADANTRQEVVVTDIGMRFTSMVRFMVKWAIASIPALIILFVITAAFWAIVIGLFSSFWGRPFSRSATSAATSDVPAATDSPTNSGGTSASSDAAELTYLSKVVVSNVSVAQAELGGMGVFGEVKNTGDRTLKEVEITIYCLGPDGKTIFEKKYDPVLVSELGIGDNNEPLKPGYVRKFGVSMDDAPSEWKRQVSVKVTTVQFQ